MKLAAMYAELVSEGGHYSHFWLMACQINDAEAHERLDAFEFDAELIRQSHDLPILH